MIISVVLKGLQINFNGGTHVFFRTQYFFNAVATFGAPFAIPKRNIKNKLVT